MFGLFKKKNDFQFGDDEVEFFRNIIKILPQRYSYLESQITKEFILKFKPNQLGYKYSYTFVLNANLENKFLRKDVPQYYIIKNIGIWENVLNIMIYIELDIITGYIGGFKSESLDFKNFDFSRSDLSKLTEKHFSNQDREELLKIIGEVDKQKESKLDIEDTFKIEIPEGDFYTIKNLGDGNYLAVDKQGVVYELLHDPYSVLKKADSINSL
ncbi:hypothetical protein HER18_02670 [Chryseobacterium sp. NEB161]|nr:hypothetical protein HER18_02670 [Chryseobacterium sp. NEB161]